MNHPKLIKEFRDNGSIKKEYTEIDGVISGIFISYLSSGKIFSLCHYKDGEINGELVKYNGDGSISSRNHYKDGMLDGNQLYYGRDYLVMSVAYKKDLRDGVSFAYNKDGSIQGYETYRFDILHGLSTSSEGQDTWYIGGLEVTMEEFEAQNNAG